MPAATQPPRHPAVITLISPDQFTPYRNARGADTAGAPAPYRSNAQAAATFHEPLRHLKITLRHTMDARLAHPQQHHNPAPTDGYDNPTTALSNTARTDTPHPTTC